MHPVKCSHLGHEPVIRNLSITEATVLWALSDSQYQYVARQCGGEAFILRSIHRSALAHWLPHLLRPAECRQAPVSCHYLSGAVISSQPLTLARRFRSLLWLSNRGQGQPKHLVTPTIKPLCRLHPLSCRTVARSPFAMFTPYPSQVTWGSRLSRLLISQ
jgi:hypothetical protein